MKINLKIRGNDKKDIFKILMVIVVINILVAMISIIFASKEILKIILTYGMTIIYIGVSIYIFKKVNSSSNTSSEKFNNKYDPMLTRFLLKNEIIIDEELFSAMVYYLIRKEYVYIDEKEKQLVLKDRNIFKQIDALERITSEKIETYSTEEIPSYISLFITKILFAFYDKIELNDLKNKIKENYYLERGEIHQLAMEKMLLYEIEKNKMLGNKNQINYLSISSIMSVITTIITFVTIGRFNIILLLGAIIYIALNVVITKNENILSYKYTEEVSKYIDSLQEFVYNKSFGSKNEPEEISNEENLVEEKNKIEEEENTSEEENITEKEIEEDNKGNTEIEILFGIKKYEDLYK